MRFTRDRRREHLWALDMTPMIDIVFQLLIFFLTTAQLARMSRADIELPPLKGEDERLSEQSGLVVNVTAAGEIVVDERTIDLVELEALAAELASAPATAIRGAATTFRPLVRADAGAPAARLNAVLESLERAGVAAVRLATNPGPSDGR